MFQKIKLYCRGLHMIQLFFEYIVNDLESGKGSEDLVACFNKSYELTLEPYHGYIAQQLYGVYIQNKEYNNNNVSIIVRFLAFIPYDANTFSNITIDY
jgi:hypothetical protein